MDARLKVELAGSKVGNLRRGRASLDDILEAEMELAAAQFEWAVEKACQRFKPSRELAVVVCERLLSGVA